MKATFPPLPIAEDVFRTMVRMHEQHCSYEQIGTAVAMSAQEVEALRWKHLDRWLKERETIGKAVRSDFIMAIVAHLQLVLSVTENPKDLALLTKAMDGILKHDPLHRSRTQTMREMPTPEPDVEPEQAVHDNEPSEVVDSEPAPASVPNPDDFTRADVMLLSHVCEQASTPDELLSELQQRPALYMKCLRIGVLPKTLPPLPPLRPQPPPPPTRRTWRQGLAIGLRWACSVAILALGTFLVLGMAPRQQP